VKTAYSIRIIAALYVLFLTACGGDGQNAEISAADTTVADTTLLVPADTIPPADTTNLVIEEPPAEEPPQEETPPPQQEEPDEPAPAAGPSEELIAQGQQVFNSSTCRTCHGPTATGTPLAPNLRDSEWINIEQPVTVDKIAQLVRTGVVRPVRHPAPMPPMGGAQLTNDQLQAVAAYVYSLSQ
jgi:mono/diheme cytochrome c family protein